MSQTTANVIHNSEHFLSLIVPAYKQEQTIVENVTQLKEALDRIRYDYEVIIVVDGTIDETFAKIKKAKIPKVTCVTYEKNHGKAFAIRQGMNIAQGDYVMFIDSGMEIDPNGISMLMEHMEWYDADIIVGSKRHPASQVGYTLGRKILSYGYYYLVKMSFGVGVRDTQAGIKIFKKKVLEEVLPRLVIKRFAGDLEILVVAKHLGFKRIFEAPIKLNYEFSKLSSAATWNSIFNIILDTFSIFYRVYILRYYNNVHHKWIEPKGLKIYTTPEQRN